MIYKNSHDPIYIKKISVKVWSVRDEIEEVIKHRLDQMTLDEAEKEIPKEELKNILHFNDLHKEYNNKYDPAELASALSNATPPVDPMEAEMAKAISDSNATPPVDPMEAEMAKAISDSNATPPVDPLEAEMLKEINETKIKEEANKSKKETHLSLVETDNPSLPVNPGVKKEGELIKITQRHPHIDEKHLALGRLILAEINLVQMNFFIDKNFIEGQNIRIELMIPHHFIISARVKYCRKFSIKSKVIRETRLVFRMVAEFTFERAGERTLLRQFLKSISPEVSSNKKGQAKVEASTTANELDDLDL